MLDLRTELEHLEVFDSKGRRRVTESRHVERALQIIELYRLQFEKFTGHLPRISRVSIAHFYRASLLCDARKLSPEELVTYQFASMSALGIYQSSLIDSEAMLDRALERSDVKLDELSRYRANIELYNARTKLYGSELALRDTTNDFSPLFRAVMAHRLGLSDVVAKYYDAALTEYRTTQISKELFAGELGFLNPSDVS